MPAERSPRPGEAERGRAHPRAKAGVDRRRRCLLEDLLVPPLERAVALAEMHAVAVRVEQHLDLDVARAPTNRSSTSRSSPKAARASRRAAASAAVRSSGASTRCMPLPPPPADGFTSTGYPIVAAAAARRSSPWSGPS